MTICTKNRVHYFGDVEGGQIQLSPIGDIVKTEWLKTPNIRPDMNLELGNFVIMPNHFHAIIIIGQNQYNTPAETHCNASLQDNNQPKNKFEPQSKNLASIIRGFKSTVTTQVRQQIQADFFWQSRFHDHIIRNERAFHRISQYIQNNPIKWNIDRFNQ